MSKNNDRTHRIDNANDFNFSLYDAVPSRLKAVEVPAIPIDQALSTVYKQLLAMGRRPVTIKSYDYAFNMLLKSADIEYVQDIDTTVLMNFLDYLKDTGNQPSTRSMRLKSVKAILNRFFDNGWYHRKFWNTVNVKYDREVKPEAKVEDIAILINSLDKETFTGFRNAAAVLLMFKTGVRSATLSRLRESHFDANDRSLKIDGDAMKNRTPIYLPLDQDTTALLNRLIEQNRIIRKQNGKRNNYLFITEVGDSMLSKSKNNAISKAITRHAKELGLSNINPHAIRRAYAKNLLRQGANIALISRALGHSNLEVTTKYLSFELEEVKDDLRNFL